MLVILPGVVQVFVVFVIFINDSTLQLPGINTGVLDTQVVEPKGQHEEYKVVPEGQAPFEGV